MNYLLPNGVYDKIKWVVTVFMPAATVLYVALASAWGWPLYEQVQTTLVAVYTFLCSLMGISGAKAYFSAKNEDSEGGEE